MHHSSRDDRRSNDSSNRSDLNDAIENSSVDEPNWVDADIDSEAVSPSRGSLPKSAPLSVLKNTRTLVLVETAFLASASSLIWLINYYFPLGPVLKVFFPIPIALIYLRWGSRASWMTALVSGLLLSVLMGPPRSIVFLVPYGLIGVQLGACWRRRANWGFSILTGALLGTMGFFFRFWLFSMLLGEDLWLYVITQVTGMVEWVFIQLGVLAQPSIWMIQLVAVGLIFLNDIIYLFAVHLVALLVLDRLGDRIPRPPQWIQALLDYE
jgi:uncharacterized protein YybS (DUF2232 family)